MSITDKRAEIAAALGDVTVLTGYARPPAVVKPGDAWPRWRGGERDGGTAYMQTWSVVVVLPADEVAADAWVDAHAEDVAGALADVLFVSGMEPARLPTEGGDVYALMITGRSE